MSNQTNARIRPEEESHWYTKDGIPVHEVISKSTGNMRPTTLRDARKFEYLPSVTNVQKIVAKPALTGYLIEQACLAVLTAPEKPGEIIDDRVKRVLQDERQQDEHRKYSADLGTLVHKQLQTGEESNYTSGVFDWLEQIGASAIHREKVVVGDGYAGTCDWIGVTNGGAKTIIDWKTSGSLPERAPWPEHEEQVAAYAAASIGFPDSIIGYICYISTAEDSIGRFFVHKIERERLLECHKAFMHVVALWQHRNGYFPCNQS